MQRSADHEAVLDAVGRPGFWQGLAASAADALVRAGEGTAVSAPRQIIRARGGDGLGVMAGIVDGGAGSVVGVKLVTLPHLRQAGAPSHPGSVLLLDVATGDVRARLDADLVTALRTAATTAAVTRCVRPDARRLTVVGTGTEARSHLRALGALFPAAELTVWGRDQRAAEGVASELRGTGLEVGVAGDLRAALAGADVVTSVTSATSPFLGRDLLGDVTHVNAVGASVRGLREWRPDVFEAADVILCDDVEECGRQSDEVPAGCLGRAVNVAGHLDASRTWPRRPAGLSVFKSVGLAVLDVAAAAFLLEFTGGAQGPLSREGRTSTAAR